MNRLRPLVYSIVVICALGALLSTGQVRYLFTELLILLLVFLIVVELVPQYIVADEIKEAKHIE